MTKHSKRRGRSRRRNFVAISFTEQLALSTLANNTVLAGRVTTGTFGEDFYAVSADVFWSLQELTANEVPIEVGLAHNDLSVTEISENLDSERLSPDDIIANERARRPVRRSGMFNGTSETHMQLNDGKQIRTPLRFSIGSGFALAFWARNISGSPLTTGALLDVNGTLYGRWQR